ncbi:GvpL/GvpF family gas vesicle protein [Salsuginibacillus kocurii]|uniref:GvpL/GvpF family gas vesicle protein n=1 Tax=Salsuginibacillus kocurii TaxID=427078 RepID=UPI00037675B5|nr:GvpL/GvpF family gas vesicle protein [Salsuginibacillus kocurii]
MNRGYPYIFGMVPSAEEHDYKTVQMEGTPVQLRKIPKEEVSLIVGDVPAMALAPTEENARAHKEALEMVMEEETVAPMNFGTVLADDQEAERLLEAVYETVRDTFPKIENKIEVAVQISLTDDAFKQLFAGKSRKGRRHYKAQLELGEKVKAMVDRYRQEQQPAIARKLAPLSESSMMKEPVTEKMIFHGVFLVDKENEAAFDEAVNELYESWQGAATFNYSGPWPAYHFIEMRFAAKG